MPKIIRISELTTADRNFVLSINNNDGTVTLYYRGELLPVFAQPPIVLHATQYQLRISLIELNRWAAFKTAYAALTEKEKIILDHRRVFRRNDPVLIKALNAAGATPAQITALFEYAQNVVDEE